VVLDSARTPPTKTASWWSNTAANTLVAFGPISNDAVCSAGIPAGTLSSTLSLNGAGITFNTPAKPEPVQL